MSEWRTFITDNYTFDKNKGYVLDTSRPMPKFLQRLNKGINRTFRTLRTSNPFNLTTPSVPRTGEVSQVTGGSSDNKSPYEKIDATDGGSFINRMKNISTSPSVTGSSYSIATGKQMQGTLGVADLMLGPLAGPAKLLSGLTKAHLETISARAALGDEGFAIGMYDGRPIGLSKGFLGYQLTGVYPEDQRRNIINDLLQLSQQGKGSGFLGSQYTKFGMGDAGFDKEFTKSINESNLSTNLKNRLLDTSTKIKTSDQYVKETEKTGKVSSGQSFDTLRQEKQKTKEGAEGFTGEFGFNDGGFIGGPPSQYSPQKTIADDVNFEAREGGFVINAPAVQKFGEKKLNAMYNKAKKQSKSPSLAMGGEVPIKISKGEMYIPPEHVNAMGGMEFLKKINDQGKPTVTALNKGFMNGYNQGDEVQGNEVDIGYEIPSDDFMSKLKDFNKKKRNRSERDNFILSLSDEEALSLAFLTETVASKASLTTMQKIGDVILNRVNDQQFEFKNLKSIKDVLLQRTNRGKGSKMVAFDGLEPSILQARISEILSGKAPDALEKTYTAAINTLDTEPDLEQYRLPSHILYYKKPGVGGSSWHDKSPLLAPLIDDEGHTFYGRYMTEEFP
tara:strand:+ start:1489 stop:3339 length:1851 start_codon:yes stop_codon:yes gene_type:complete